MKISVIVSFAAGFVTGAGTAFVAVKKYFEKKHEEEEREMRKNFHKMCKDLREGKTTLASFGEEEKVDLKEEEKVLAETNEEKPVSKKLSKTYEPILKAHNRSISVSKTEVYNPPFQITESEFGCLKTFDEIRMIWFATEDYILCDAETGTVVEELDEFVGKEGCELLYEDMGLPAIVYIRNPIFRLDIAVKIERKARYAETYMKGQPGDVL